MLNGGNGAYKDCKYDVNTESSYNGCIWHFFLPVLTLSVHFLLYSGKSLIRTRWDRGYSDNWVRNLQITEYEVWQKAPLDF